MIEDLREELNRTAEPLLEKLNLHELMEFELLTKSKLEAIQRRRDYMIECKGKRLCIICFEKPYSMMLKPCYHVCVC